MDNKSNIPGKALDSTLRVKAVGNIQDVSNKEKSVEDPTPEQARAMLEGSDEDINTDKSTG